MGDPERSLLLLERLGRETTNGNDLFFIHHALEQVAWEHSGLKRRAEGLQAHLYGHLPAPDEALFSTVQTRDGEVSLWADIPAGEFLMGSPKDEEGRYDDEGPQHSVTISRPFQIAVVPVTNAQYSSFDASHPLEAEKAHHPVVKVTWYQAMSFCRWLSARVEDCRGVRLPLEAEWEYACRAGTTTRFWSGDEDADLDRVAWYVENSGRRTHAVGEKPANPWGLYDVHGNVREWCRDAWVDSYKEREAGVVVNPCAPPAVGEPGARRVIRGGGFLISAGAPRSACRLGWDPGFVLVVQGFRLLRPPPS